MAGYKTGREISFIKHSITMKLFLFICALVLLTFSAHLHTRSSSNCFVVVNGVDLATKVDGKIVGYDGTSVDRSNNVAVSKLTVESKDGPRNIVVNTPLGKDGEFSQSGGCSFSSEESEGFSPNAIPSRFVNSEVDSEESQFTN